ncbi:MAG TPA: glycosyltransferase family 39 protein, partial [Allocoleopsis sp.]
MVDSRVGPIAAPVRKHNWLQYLSLGFVLFGALVRLVQYLSNRSLWSDEAMLALNIVNRSYQELIQPLDYNQAAPLGFLWIEKLAVQLLGNNEYALRFFPLISGIAALGIVYLLSNRYLSAVGVPIAVALFASLHYLVYYTTEVKQYSSDVMIALLLWFVLVPHWQQLLNRKQTILLGLLGAAAIWVSHPTVLMLAAIETSCFLITTHPQRLKILINRLPLYLAWLASFICFYWLTIRSTLENESLTSSWNKRYPDSLLDFPWLFKALDRFFSNPLGFSEITDGIAMFAFIVGCIALYRRNRLLLLTFTAPFMITLVLSYLHQYPFRQRLVLFLVPFAILIIAEGIAALITLPRRHSKVILAIGTFVFVTLLVPAVVQSSQLLAYPEKVEEIRPVMAYIQTHQQPDD